MPATDPQASYIVATCIAPGVLRCTIQTTAYFMVGEHWRNQLTGRNSRKWGRIFIDPDRSEKVRRRQLALEDWRGLFAGQRDINCDECPGAMFIWDTQAVSHVEPLCAVSNQAFGRDLYWALYRGVKEAMIKKETWATRSGSFMGWWQVRFQFVG